MKLKFWQTRSWSPIMPPLKKLKGFTDTFFITNTPSINEAEEFDRHVLDHQYCLHWRNWRVWQTRSSSPILPPLMKLTSLTDTFLITNTPSINEAEEFDRQILDYQYSLHWRSWRVWQTRSWSPILPPIKKLKSLTDPFLITNTPSINEAEILTDTFLITNNTSTEETEEFDRHVLYHQYSLHCEAEEFDRHVLDHQYTIHWRSWRVWLVHSWSPIHPPLKKLKSLTDTLFITNTPSVEEAVTFGRHVLITNTPSIEEAEEFDRHVLDHQYSLH